MTNIILRRLIAGLALATLSLSFAPAQADTLDNIKKAGKVRIAIDTAIPPFGMTDEKLQPTGSDVDTAQLLAKDLLTDPGDSSNAADDGMRSVLEDHIADPVRSELKGFIDALTQDEQIDLVALTWLGRGDGEHLRRRGAVTSPVCGYRL